MAKIDKRVCPREQFVKDSFSSGATKFGQLRAILKHIAVKVDPFTITQSLLDKMLDDEFAAVSNGVMLPFEADEEKARMRHLLLRWLNFERRNKSSKVLARDFTNDF